MKTVMLNLKLTSKWTAKGLRLGLLFILIGQFKTTVASEGLSGPKDVRLESSTEHSITIVWTAPDVSKSSDLKIKAYVLVCAPVGVHSHDERELLLPPTVTSGRVADLEKGKHYSIVVSAVYTSYKRVSSPKLVVSTKDDPKMEMAVSDDIFPEPELECNCSAPGMLACTRTSQAFKCNCYEGYEGMGCELCSPDYIRVEKDCQLCPCTNTTSTGVCVLNDKMEVVCESCFPGHRGNDCGTCMAGYHWKEKRCQPVNCLSYSLCAEEKDAPGCGDCFPDKNSPPTAQKSNAERTIADGTVPLVAVIVTLAVIVLVAAGATCYRYWTRQRTRPRLPFFSIELREEKVNLGADCHYQHLDAASSRMAAVPDGTPAKQATINV